MAGEKVQRTVEIRYDDGSGEAWHDISSDALNRDPVSISRGIANEGGSADPGSLGLSLWNGTSKVEAGVSARYAQRNPLSDLYGLIGPNLPIRISAGLDGSAQTVRMVGETVALPPRWDLSGRDRWVPVEAAGVLRRLGIPASPLPPALIRATKQDSAVVACWPLAGLGQDVRLAPSAVPGVAPMRVRRINSGNPLEHAVSWSADSTGPGLGALPAVQSTEAGVGLTGPIPSGIADRFGWSIWGRGDGDDDLATSITMWVDTESTKWVLWVQWSGSGVLNEILVTVQAQDDDGNLVASLSATNDVTLTDRWENFAAIVEQDGADVDLTVLVNGAEIAMSPDSGSLSGLDVGTPWQSRATDSLNVGRSMAIGYPTVVSGESVAAITAAIQGLYTAGRGHAGETAGRRVERLCDEQGVAFTSTGDLDATALLGPQHPDGFLAVLGEAAKVEAAGSPAPILTEQRDGLGLHFRSLRSLYAVS